MSDDSHGAGGGTGGAAGDAAGDPPGGSTGGSTGDTGGDTAGVAGIDAAAVTRWLAEHVAGFRPPATIALVSGGRSNITCRVTDASGTDYALRRPPTGAVLSTAHDMSREWRFISALAPTDVPVAYPLAYCRDREITKADFYVMRFVDGVVPVDEESAGALAGPARRRVGEDLIDVMVDLHRLVPERIGLGDLVREEGYVERQLRRWRRQLHASGSPDLALLDDVHDALAGAVPPQSTGIVHGDFRPGNLAFDRQGTVLAVFDWELATTGDPLADLGWLLSTWAEPGDELPPTTPGPSAAGGFATRAELTERYARRSGRDVSALPYYVAFSRWRSACIGAGVRARYAAGAMADDGYSAELRADDASAQAAAAHQAVKRLGLLR